MPRSRGATLGVTASSQFAQRPAHRPSDGLHVRAAFMVMAAALSAASVAPAQVNSSADATRAAEWTPLPEVPVDQLLQQGVDPLAPEPEAETAEPHEDVIEPGATLAETVANLRG